jgi:nucleoside-diphosphate-sugar epimerase
MRHVITGGSGFTGQALVALLAARGADIVNFDLVEPKSSVAQLASFIQGDVREPRSLRQLALRETDIVYHLAARQFGGAVPKYGRDAWFFEVNVGGTQHVLDSMLSAGAHQLVFFSTDMTYGMPTVCPVPPSHPQNPLGSYGRAKLEAERRIAIAARSGISATIFRPRLITGPGRLGILQQLFKLIRAGLPVPLIGSGRNRYQMVGVEDCARAAIRAADLGCPSGPFNLGSASPPSTRELLSAVIAHAKSRSFLIPTPAMPLKMLLACLDRFGMTLLYPEQFLIADVDILLDTASTQLSLGWKPEKDDISMMIAAYDAFSDLRRYKIKS